MLLREEMTMEEELDFVEKAFDEYEKEGFSNVFVSPYDPLIFQVDRQGSNFKVISRCKPFKAEGESESTSEDVMFVPLEMLPMWVIEFPDGRRMNAYPEEIVPSEIKDNLWRNSDEKYLKLMKTEEYLI